MKHSLSLAFAPFVAFVIGTGQAKAELIINEFMQSNIDCIMDDIHEFPDSWVELYNNSDQAVDLGEYSIGVKEKVSKAYQLPPKSIPAHGHVIIYCDKEERRLHTSFRLESGKDGAIYLFKNGEQIEKIEGIKKMPAPNVAYGRVTDGSEEWGYQLTPTPGKSNEGKVTDIILPDPVFSETGKVLESPITITLSIPEDAPQGTIIRYTTDCSEPTEESPVYSSPLDIETTTIIRAKLFCENTISPRSVTQSYIYHHADMTLPIVSIVTDNDNFYDNLIGILVDGPEENSIPNWRHDWRRPINFEYFTSDNSDSKLNQLCETRLKGQATRHLAAKSMVIYANKRFGTKRLNEEFFPTQRPGSTDFKSIELRNSGNDYNRLYMRDALVQRTMGENADLDWQAYQPVVVYLNGKYHALLNLRERSNEDNIYTNYDGLEDIDLIENMKEVKEGSIDNFEKFREFYSQENHTLDEYREWMDVEEFINYFIMQSFFANVDFPGNNYMMWRPLEDGGKWRWICKDLDLTIGMQATAFDFDYFDWLHNPENYPDKNWATNEESTRMFRNLLAIPEFVEEFTDKYAIYLGDFLHSERIIKQMDEMYEAIQHEYPFHYNKNLEDWGVDYSYFQNHAYYWIRGRYDFLYEHLANKFNLPEPAPININTLSQDISSISFNGIKLSANSFNGQYFAGKNITLSANIRH